MIQFAIHDGQLVCRMHERMDNSACMTAEAALRERVQSEGLPVLFDMADVVYVSSAFIRLCIQTYKTVGGARFALQHVSPDVKRVFKIAGLDDQLRML